MSDRQISISEGTKGKADAHGLDDDLAVLVTPRLETAPVRRDSQAIVGRVTSLLPLLLSCALHAAPLGVLAYLNIPRPPLSAGETVMEIEFVVAEAESQPSPVLDVLPQTPDPVSTMPPSVDAAQAPEKKPEEIEKPDEAAEFPVPIAEPEPVTLKAEDKVISVANAAPLAVASTEILAAADDGYRARIARHLAKFKRFPAEMPRSVAGGKVTISFSIGPDGRVLNAQVVLPSGVPAIDAEAMAMLRRAEPFPTPPHAGRMTNSFVIPVAYRWRD
jgi:protein TonB